MESIYFLFPQMKNKTKMILIWISISFEFTYFEFQSKFPGVFKGYKMGALGRNWLKPYQTNHLYLTTAQVCL